MDIDPRLFVKPFTAAEVAYASNCSEDTLANYIFKNHLAMCSEPPGRGRGRKFPLIDVFQATVMTAIVGLSRDAQGAAQICDHCLFAKAGWLWVRAEKEGRQVTKEEFVKERSRLALTYIYDFSRAPVHYRELDLEKPWILNFDLTEDGRAIRPEWFKWGEERIWSTPDIAQGCYLNATKKFVAALQRLHEKL